MPHKNFAALALGVVIGLSSIVFPALADISAAIYPSGVGSNNGWSTVGTSTHYLNVDETTCNGITDYNLTTTVGKRDSYAISVASVPNGAKVTSIGILPCASRNTSGGTDPIMNVFYRANGATSSDAGSYSLTGTTPVGLATTSITANFIKTATSTMEIGAVYASGTKGVRLSRIVAYITYTPLAAPTGLSATATTSSQVLLNWTDNSTFESGYSVERSTDGVNYGAIASTSAFATSGSYYDKTVAASTLYLYRVRAFDAGGYSAYSNIAYASTTGSVPNAPSNLTASASGTTVTLNWFDNSSNETAFELLRSTDGSTFLHLASTTASTTAYNDTGVAPGTYWYRVRAANSSGYSSTTNTATATVSLSLPLDPTGLVASSTTFGTTSVASLQWTDNATNESSYTVERGPSPLSFDTTFSGLAVDTHVFQDYSVASGQTYFYRVYASNTSGNSGYSNIATTTVP